MATPKKVTYSKAKRKPAKKKMTREKMVKESVKRRSKPSLKQKNDALRKKLKKIKKKYGI